MNSLLLYGWESLKSLVMLCYINNAGFNLIGFVFARELTISIRVINRTYRFRIPKFVFWTDYKKILKFLCNLAVLVNWSSPSNVSNISLELRRWRRWWG